MCIRDRSNTEWFNLPDKVWGNIATTYETADGDDYYSGTNSSNSFGRFAGTVDAANYIKALSTAETTYTQNWDGTATVSYTHLDVYKRQSLLHLKV